MRDDLLYEHYLTVKAAHVQAKQRIEHIEGSGRSAGADLTLHEYLLNLKATDYEMWFFSDKDDGKYIVTDNYLATDNLFRRTDGTKCGSSVTYRFNKGTRLMVSGIKGEEITFVAVGLPLGGSVDIDYFLSCTSRAQNPIRSGKL